MSPPVGFRRAIPLSVKIKVVLRCEGKCSACGQRLGELEDVEFDHVPALQLRGWDPVQQDTIPGCNDPAAIEAKHADCHAQKTSGRKGESKLSKVGGDTSEIAKLRRLSRKAEEFRSKILAKDDPDETQKITAQKPKRAWPKRKFDNRRD